MQNLVEFLIFFDTCLIFTMFSFVLSDPIYRIIFRVLSMPMWIFLAIFYVGLMQPEVPMAGYFFLIPGVASMLMLLRDFWFMMDKRKWG
jgi:hypothetical protein